MWGNSLGWTISLLILLLVGGWVYLIEHNSTITPATGFSANEANFQPVRIPELPRSILPQSGADAGPMYRSAIEMYLQDRATYSNFAALGTLDSPLAKKLPAIEPLVEASNYASMNLFAARPSEIVNYNLNKPSLEALETLGKVCVDRLALLNQRAGNKEEAMKYYRAGLMLGLHLCEERVCYAQFALGLQLLGKTTPMLAKLCDETGKPVDAAAYRDFDARRIAFAQSLEPTLRIVQSLDAKTVGAHTGDMFELAKRSKERMWRVEALLALGRVRYFAGTGGTAANQRAAMELLREVAEHDEDYVVRTAAGAARNLTVEEHRMQ
ncbi:MAG: hypothetical protein QOF78_1061 [Phycisphaerales bacterium]|jgi:TPR repeat protein|nr:hypothetical protein [Phycisphaerales bacterium]